MIYKLFDVYMARSRAYIHEDFDSSVNQQIRNLHRG